MTAPYYSDDTVTLHHGDALTVLRELPDASVHAVITDPPYEIGIADQEWDRSGIAYSVPMWSECLRVLKPGGHLLSFGHVRTYHRMVCAAEDAGFRVVDQIDWIYTHGKPKGADVARAIDRRRDDREDVLQVTAWLKDARDAAGWTNSQINDLFGFAVGGQAQHWMTQGVAAAVPTPAQWDQLREALGFDDAAIRRTLEHLWARKGTVGEAFHCREIVSESRGAARDTGLYRGYSGHHIKARAASPDALRWEGWHTALRPAHDPILLARKSVGFDTLTASVVKQGTGALHTAACPAEGGGWPTNIVLGHDCDPVRCESGCPVGDLGDKAPSFPIVRLASRTPVDERMEVDGVRHDTPKPRDLMRWLVRLVTPPRGIALDPLAGSGTTLLAARDEGVGAIGIEAHERYTAIARCRLEEPSTAPLFGLEGATT